MTTAEREDQRARALTKANEIRVANGILKREIKALPRYDAMHLVADLLEDNVAPANSLPAQRLIWSIPRIGDARLRGVFYKAQVFNVDRRVKDLTDRQRRALAFELRLRARILG